MPRVWIDGKEYEVRDGINMLDAVLSVGLDLPYFCWHPAMGSVGACRQCAVRVYKDESDTRGKIEMACMTPAKDGTRISITDPEANEFRRYIIEWLMTNHPHDCPVCDEGGECHLQDMTCMTGHVYRRFRGRKRTYRNQYLGPFVTHEMNRCIQCWRCVRFYRDMAGGRDFNVFGSKNRVYFGRAKDGILESPFAGNLVEVCPTGVFTDKTLQKHYTRKWDLETAPSVCIHCGLGCNTIPGARYGKLRRIRARYNPNVNGYFLCDRGRYGYEFVNSKARARQARIDREAVPWEQAIEKTRAILDGANRVIGIGSPRASLESNYALRKLVGENSFSTGLSDYEQQAAQAALELMRNGTRMASLAEVQSADKVLVLDADPLNEAPMLEYYLRQAQNRLRLKVSRALGIPDWDANAVATAAAGVERRDLRVESPDGLAGAERPLVVTSLSAGADVVRQAGEIAASVPECMLSIIAPEANTIGVAMMGGKSVDEALGSIEPGDALIVLENDLARRVEPALFERAMDIASVTSLDCIETHVTGQAEVVLPVPAYVETNGTFVNNECRAQRFYQAFIPKGDIRHAWDVCQQLAAEHWWASYQDVLNESASLPVFEAIVDAAPMADWRSEADQNVARQSHRFSGRTAKDADWTMDEPKPQDDPGTPFAFSMEGDQAVVPGALEPRYWWPGWNSTNSITKFQIEVNGSMHGGNTGGVLRPEVSGESAGGGILRRAQDEVVPEPGEVWLSPRTYVFGSEELSRLAPGVAELAAKAGVSLHPETAEKLGLIEGELADIRVAERSLRLPVRLDEALELDAAQVPAGLPETVGIVRPMAVKIVRAE